MTHSVMIGARSTVIYRKTAAKRYPTIAYFRIVDETDNCATTFVRVYRRREVQV